MWRPRRRRRQRCAGGGRHRRRQAAARGQRSAGVASRATPPAAVAHSAVRGRHHTAVRGRFGDSQQPDRGGAGWRSCRPASPPPLCKTGDARGARQSSDHTGVQSAFSLSYNGAQMSSIRGPGEPAIARLLRGAGLVTLVVIVFAWNVAKVRVARRGGRAEGLRGRPGLGCQPGADLAPGEVETLPDQHSLLKTCPGGSAGPRAARACHVLPGGPQASANPCLAAPQPGLGGGGIREAAGSRAAPGLSASRHHAAPRPVRSRIAHQHRRVLLCAQPTGRGATPGRADSSSWTNLADESRTWPAPAAAGERATLPPALHAVTTRLTRPCAPHPQAVVQAFTDGDDSEGREVGRSSRTAVGAGDGAGRGAGGAGRPGGSDSRPCRSPPRAPVARASSTCPLLG